LGAAQADLTETKARQLRGELVEAIKVEKLWTSKLKAFPNRILAIPHRDIYRPGKSFVPRSMSLLRDKAPNVKGAIDEGSTWSDTPRHVRCCGLVEHRRGRS
jgi:hypothetical protein